RDEFGNLGGVPIGNGVALDHVKGVVGLKHVQLRQGAPGAPHRVEITPSQLLEPRHLLELLVDQFLGCLEIVAHPVHKVEGAELQGGPASWLPVLQLDELETASSQVSHKAKGL